MAQKSGLNVSFWQKQIGMASIDYVLIRELTQFSLHFVASSDFVHELSLKGVHVWVELFRAEYK